MITKNQFIFDLNDYLSGILGTSQENIYEQGKSKPLIRGSRRDSLALDLDGFEFRKTLCSYDPLKEISLQEQVIDFANQRGIEANLKDNSLKLKFGNRSYLVETTTGELIGVKLITLVH